MTTAMHSEDAEARVREALYAAWCSKCADTWQLVDDDVFWMNRTARLATPVLAAIRAAAGTAVDIPWDVLYSRVQNRALNAAVRALSSPDTEEGR